MDQHVADGQELRFVLTDYTTVGRDVDLAVCKGVESIEGFVARHAWHQVNLDFYLCRGEVIYTLGLDLAFLDGFGDAFNQSAYGLGVGQFADDEGLLVEFLDFGTHFQHTASLAVVIFRDIDTAARLEIGIEMELLSMQVLDSCIADFTEVMG